MSEIKRSKSYQAIVVAAKMLFWKHGIGRVTVEEISQAAGVSKMTFYRNFKNKNDVAKRVLLDLIEQSEQLYLEIMTQDIAYSEKIRQSIKIKHEFWSGVSQEFLTDLYQRNESGLLEILETYGEKSRKRALEDLKDAQAKGWIRQDIRPAFLLYMMNDMNKKLMDKELVSQYDDMTDFIMELTNFFFYGIMPRKED